MKKSFFILMFLITLSPIMAQAQAISQPGTAAGISQPGTAGAISNQNCNPQRNGPGTYTLCDPLGIKNFCDLVKALLNIVLAIGVPIAVLFLVWSGFRFILARGSQTGLAEAKKNFMYVIIGIAIFLGAWTLATIISATIQTLDSSGTIQFCGR